MIQERYPKSRKRMKARSRITFAMIGLVTLAVVRTIATQDAVPSAGCADLHWPALERNDVAYAHAAALARALIEHGFTITCVAPSKMTGMFEGEVGAALYRTNQSDFEALFLPKPQSFAELDVLERQENGRYMYSFRGRPNPWPANLIDASHPVYFIKHVNQLIITDDKELAAHLRTTLAGL
jgi:hypothetical protein